MAQIEVANLGSVADEPFQKLEQAVHERMVAACLGSYEEVWYKFKRFENLSLLNLYYYQHQLILLDKKIFGQEGVAQKRAPLSFAEWQRLSNFLKEYQNALHQFKTTCQLQRPPIDERQSTNSIFGEKFKEPQYQKAWDSLCLMDVGPEALHVEKDGGRALITKYARGPRPEGPRASRRSCLVDEDESREELRKELERYDAMEGMTILQSAASPLDFHDTPPPPMRVKTLVGRRIQAAMTTKPRGTAERLASFIIALVAGLSLLAPMIALTYINRQAFVLLTTCLFVLAFAFLVSMFAHGSTQEVMVATATYAAVLVVFVGQSNGPVEIERRI